MAVNDNVVVQVLLTDNELQGCAETATRITAYIKDRANLHQRDYLERFIDVLLGEIAEQAVIKWLTLQGKYARPASDKTSPRPDPGHDVVLRKKTASGYAEVLCSVKSSLSAHKAIPGILAEFTVATTPAEVREVNIQVYFWLTLNPAPTGHRVTVPSTQNMALIGWIGKNELKSFAAYATEKRQAPKKKLREIHPMAELLDFLI